MTAKEEIVEIFEASTEEEQQIILDCCAFLLSQREALQSQPQ